MKAPPTNPDQLRSRAFAALIEDMFGFLDVRMMFS